MSSHLLGLAAAGTADLRNLTQRASRAGALTHSDRLNVIELKPSAGGVKRREEISVFKKKTRFNR